MSNLFKGSKLKKFDGIETWDVSHVVNMESMFEGISTNGMFGGGNAEKIYRSFLINEYGKSMAQNGTVGIADYVMKTLLDVQEQQSALTRQEQTQEV